MCATINDEKPMKVDIQMTSSTAKGKPQSKLKCIYN